MRPSADDARADAPSTHTTPRTDRGPTHTTPRRAGADDARDQAASAHTTPRRAGADDDRDRTHAGTSPRRTRTDDAGTDSTCTTPRNSADGRADARPTHTTPSNSADGTDSTCTTNVCARSIRRLLAAAAFALLCLADPLSARAQTVDHVLTATGEVHDVATLAAPEGERTLLATSGGLVVLDAGLRPLRTLTTRDGLPGARLRSVSVTSDAIWLGGVEGLVRLDHHLRPTLARPERRVRRVVEWDGHTWIASYGEGLFRDGEPVDTGRSHARRRLTDLVVRRVRDTEELWVATAGAGVLRLAPDGRLLGRLVRHHGLPDDLVWDLEPSADALFVATARGIARVEGDTVVRRAAVTRAGLRVPDVRHVHVAGDTLYAATYGGGLHRFDGARFRVLGPRDLRAHRVVSGASGVLVAHAEGLARLDGRHLRPLLEDSLPSADVTALARAFGRLFVGTFDRGLASLDARGRVRSYANEAERWHLDGRINDLEVTGRGDGQRLWIATDRGLYWHDGRRFVRVEDPHAPGRVHVTSMHVRGDDLWVTSSRLLSHFDGERWRSFGGDERFPVMQLHAVTTDADGTVWVGSLHGLFRLDTHTGRYERFTVSSGDLPVDWVTALSRIDGRVVAGTYHGGLAWERGDGFSAERMEAGWVNPHAMQTLDDRLWVGTLERGLLVGRRGDWTHLGVEDGLPSADVTDILRDGDHVWVATRGGLARLTPH